MLHFQPEAMQVLMEHSWPGNVRELENVVERAVVLATDSSVPIDVLPDALLQANGIRLQRSEGTPAGARRLAVSRSSTISSGASSSSGWSSANWSQTEAAESLHVPLSTLNQKIKRLNIKIRKKSGSDVE